MSEVVAIVQARLDSKRLPGKTLMDVAGHPLLVRVLERARRIPGVGRLIVATTTLEADFAIVACAETCGIESFRGHPEDVLDRFYHAANRFDAEVIVRLTADCPLLDPQVSSQVLVLFSRGGLDYASNTLPPSYPDGLDTEVFSIQALTRAWMEATLPSEREHVTPYLWKRPELFRSGCLRCTPNLSAHRWTVDDADDLEFVRTVYEQLEPIEGPCFGLARVLALLAERPDIARLAGRQRRNQGYLVSLGKDYGA